ncbi:hypothetical protein STENM36S_03832 [Streptomyces tendae]
MTAWVTEPPPPRRTPPSGCAWTRTTWPRSPPPLQALSTPSRLLILARLREGPLPATELAAEVGMEQSACSHELRLLRNLGLVVGERRGRSVVYALHDDHVAGLLDQAVFHVEHLRLGISDTAR